MKCTKTHVSHGRTVLASIAMLLALASPTVAAPTVTRLTPPSVLFSAGMSEPPIISRFLEDQRFDLQATVALDNGQTLVAAQFLVDGVPVPGLVSAVPATIAGRVVVSLRAYATSVPGVHTLTFQAVQSDNKSVSTNGNFEVFPLRPTGLAAKNIIILIGDGMGIAHRTAARIMRNGVTLGKANAPLSMDTFPFTGIVTTHSLNSIVTDSSPGASCYATGNKANNNQHGVFPDDTTLNNAADNFDNPRVESLGEYMYRKYGRWLGIVTTTDLFDSTPGAFGSHTQQRASGTGIIDQFFDERHTKGLSVVLGGGRKWFLPNTMAGSGRTIATDGILSTNVAYPWGVPTGAIDPGRNLISEFINAGFTYVPDANSLTNVSPTTQKLLGLFNFSNMNVAKDKIDKRRNPGVWGVVDDFGFPDQPMLDEMTDKALQVLSQNPNGFVAMIEGGSIDKMAHLMDSERWILDTIEFDRAIERCRQFALANPDTLVIVTADHECAGANVIGASRVTHAQLVDRVIHAGYGTNGVRNGVVGTLDQAGFPRYTIALDGYPVTTDIDGRMLVGYACNADRYEDWITNLLPIQNASHSIASPVLPNYPQNPLQRDTVGNYLVTGQIADQIATHTASDIVLSAFGRNAALFSGVMDNTDVFFKVVRVAVGDSTVLPQLQTLNGHPGRGVPAEPGENQE